ncbi:MAG: SMI1/KNR4 family protein [Alphaproteobacteria bacterium]|nr:SMI1/KNR4 family protein [Alphaproteobacteria bacterium]
MNLNNLKKKAKYLVEQDAIVECCIPDSELSEISSQLDIILPHDFVEISAEISLDSFATMQFFGIAVKYNEIIDGNSKIRKQYIEDSKGKSDMSHILVLADDDSGSVFMITQDSPEKPTPVIWCDYGDMYYYSIHKEFRNPHDEWPSFTVFFEYLVEQEEQKLREDLS